MEKLNKRDVLINWALVGTFIGLVIASILVK